jgi:hypothetical protein
MAKRSTRTVALVYGHPTTFKRTVTTGEKGSTKSVQLVFEPGEVYQVSEAEFAGLAVEVASGLIVEPNIGDDGRMRPPRREAAVEPSVVADLESQIERQAQRIAELESQLQGPDAGGEGDTPS